MREEILKLFKDYTEAYDMTASKNILKAEHTYRVAGLCQVIAESLRAEKGLSDYDIDIAWCTGMLHDIGRFEQVLRYGTFRDDLSVDHAELGADLVWGPERDERLSFDYPEPELLELAVRWHNKYRLPEDLTERERLFCRIIRDADKIDIMKVQGECTPEDVLGVSEAQIVESLISDDVYAQVMEGHAVDRRIRKTAMDMVISQASMMQELEFDKSREIVRQQGYLHKMLFREVTKEQTKERLERIREKMKDLL